MTIQGPVAGHADDLRDTVARGELDALAEIVEDLRVVLFAIQPVNDVRPAQQGEGDAMLLDLQHLGRPEQFDRFEAELRAIGGEHIEIDLAVAPAAYRLFQAGFLGDFIGHQLRCHKCAESHGTGGFQDGTAVEHGVLLRG